MSNISTSSVSDKIRSTFDFSVDKFPLSGPDGMSTPLYGLFRSDTSSLVGSKSVTSRYVPHTTDDVCALADAAENAFDGDIDQLPGEVLVVEPFTAFDRVHEVTFDGIVRR